MFGYIMEHDNLSVICCADDVVLTANNEDNLLLHKIVTGVKDCKHDSKEKTKCLTTGKEPIRYNKG